LALKNYANLLEPTVDLATFHQPSAERTEWMCVINSVYRFE